MQQKMHVYFLAKQHHDFFHQKCVSLVILDSQSYNVRFFELLKIQNPVISSLKRQLMLYFATLNINPEKYNLSLLFSCIFMYFFDTGIILNKNSFHLSFNRQHYFIIFNFCQLQRSFFFFDRVGTYSIFTFLVEKTSEVTFLIQNFLRRKIHPVIGIT